MDNLKHDKVTGRIVAVEGENPELVIETRALAGRLQIVRGSGGLLGTAVNGQEIHVTFRQPGDNRELRAKIRENLQATMKERGAVDICFSHLDALIDAVLNALP